MLTPATFNIIIYENRKVTFSDVKNEILFVMNDLHYIICKPLFQKGSGFLVVSTIFQKGHIEFTSENNRKIKKFK